MSVQRVACIKIMMLAFPVIVKEYSRLSCTLTKKNVVFPSMYSSFDLGSLCELTIFKLRSIQCTQSEKRNRGYDIRPVVGESV